MMYKKLLFIDDQQDVLLLLERYFCRRTDVITITANDLRTAYQILEANEIAVAVCDIHLGTESGFDFARNLRAKYPKTGLILTSAWHVKSIQHKAELLDLVFIPKPFKLKDLNELIDTFLVDFSDSGQKQGTTRRAEPEPIHENRALSHFQPQDLVQLFCLNGRDVELSIKPDVEHPGGHIYIQRGQVIHAEYENRWGEEAFIHLMHLTNPILNIKGVNGMEWKQTIQTQWEQLLLYAAVQFDEKGDSPAAFVESTADYSRDRLPDTDD